MEVPGVFKLTETESRMVVFQKLTGGKMARCLMSYRVSVLQGEKVLEMGYTAR